MSLDPWDRGQGEGGWWKPIPRSQTTPLPAPAPSNLPPPSKPPVTSSLPTSASDGACRCKGAGYFTYAVPYGHPLFAVPQPCACTLARKAAEANERTAGALAVLQRDLGKMAGCTFDSFRLDRPLERATTTYGEPVSEADQRRSLIAAVAIAETYADNPSGWLYLHGPVGSGKSHLAAAIAHRLVRQGRAVAYATAGGVMAWLRSGFADHSSDSRLLALQEADLLVLDDLGTEQKAAAGSWAYQALFEILNTRYLHTRATVITANNLPEDEFDARLADRVRGSGPVLEVIASSHRRLDRR